MFFFCFFRSCSAAIFPQKVKKYHKNLSFLPPAEKSKHALNENHIWISSLHHSTYIKNPLLMQWAVEKILTLKFTTVPTPFEYSDFQSGQRWKGNKYPKQKPRIQWFRLLLFLNKLLAPRN